MTLPRETWHRAVNNMSATNSPTVLHYTGYDDDRGGVMTSIRHLAAAGNLRCVLGVNPGFRSVVGAKLDKLELPRIAGEKINPGNIWRARIVAVAAKKWLRGSPDRIFH